MPLLQGARAITVQPTIIIVDDDLGIRESLEGLLRSVGLQVRALASVAEFVKEGRPEGPACLVLDVRLPGSPGLFRGVLNQRIMRIILTRHLSIRRGNSTA